MLAAVIVPIAIYFAPSDTDRTDRDPVEAAKAIQDQAIEDAKWSSPSDWLGQIMTLLDHLYLVLVPGFFVITETTDFLLLTVLV